MGTSRGLQFDRRFDTTVDIGEDTILERSRYSSVVRLNTPGVPTSKQSASDEVFTDMDV